MEKKFWQIITLWGQWPRVLLRPFALHIFSYYTKIGLYYDSLLNNPFSILLLASLLMSYGGWTILKLLIYKPRPIPEPFSNRLQKINASSFPSIHTTNATLVALMRTWRWHQSLLHWAPTFAILPMIVCVGIVCVGIALSRIPLGKHYPIDVFAWFIFGIIISAILWLAYMSGLFYWR